MSVRGESWCFGRRWKIIFRFIFRAWQFWEATYALGDEDKKNSAHDWAAVITVHPREKLLVSSGMAKAPKEHSALFRIPPSHYFSTTEPLTYTKPISSGFIEYLEDRLPYQP